MGMTGAETPEENLSFDEDLPLTQAAIEFASERHAGQRRRADQAPFVLHPIEAGAILERSGYPDHVIAAAVLHDVLEDTDAERSELEERFGPDVAELVATVSDDPAISDTEAQKDDVRERVRRAGGYAQAVYTADKISKVRELRLMMARGIGADAVAVKEERYRKALAMLEEEIPGSQLVEALRFELETLETLPPETGAPST
jgi:(p)ppGpp synthase/HD superfamily hydrolase